jgi:hypothetical protein
MIAGVGAGVRNRDRRNTGGRRALSVYVRPVLPSLPRRRGPAGHAATGPLAAVVAVAAALGLSACGDDDSSAGTKTVTVAAPAAAGAAGQTRPAEPPAGDRAAEGAGGEDAQEIAAAEGSYRGMPLRFVITQLERSGNTVQLGARVESLAEPGDRSIQISSAFADNEYQKLADGSSEEGFVADGLALIDTKGNKKYLVARDENGRCVCSNNLSSVFLKPGEAPVEIHATLSAPPASVKAVDVVVPNVKTFTGVPLQG